MRTLESGTYVGVRPHHHRGIHALAGHSDQTVQTSAGKTGYSRRGFPKARPACRGTPETMRIVWVFGSGDLGVRNVGVSPGETADAQNVGVSPGENRLARKAGCSPDE